MEEAPLCCSVTAIFLAYATDVPLHIDNTLSTHPASSLDMFLLRQDICDRCLDVRMHPCALVHYSYREKKKICSIAKTKEKKSMENY